MRFLRQNSLSLFFGAIFLATLLAQAVAGWHDLDNQLLAQQLDPVPFGWYLRSADLAVDVAENWQSEYLQFFLYIMVTVWLVQRGSPESKSVEDAGLESDEQQLLGAHLRDDSPAWARAGGLRTTVFSWSLTSVMLAVFVASWTVQSVAGWAAYNQTRLEDFQDTLTWGGYVTGADFWSRTLQNWQSEFLAVGSMAVLSVYLRQRGSPESKPVGDAHDNTGGTG